MIEKYFLPGVRLQWSCPGAIAPGRDFGKIIDSPNVNEGLMTYDGMDAELVESAVHPTQAGLRMRQTIPYDWLCYVLGQTAKRRLSPFCDLLTGPMSGCLIASWSEGPDRYVGHVGTVEDNKAVNSTVKRTFAASLPLQAAGFYPANAWSPAEIAQKMRLFKRMPAIKVMALVSTLGAFYSVLMFQLHSEGPNRWCVGGIKPVQPLNGVRLKAMLLA